MSKFLIFLFAAALILGFVATAQAGQVPLGQHKPAGASVPAAPTPVPEPLSIALLGGGLVGLYGLKKKLGKD